MTIQEMVTLNLTPAVELTQEDIRLLLQNKSALKEVQHSALYERAHLQLQLKRHAEGGEIPTREEVKEVVAEASSFLAATA